MCSLWKKVCTYIIAFLKHPQQRVKNKNQFTSRRSSRSSIFHGDGEDAQDLEVWNYEILVY